MKKTIICLLMFLIGSGRIFAGAGKSGATFLKISPGAGPVGMGGAYTAIANDINALYYNPAGISGIRQNQIGATHTEWLEGINYDFAGGVIPVRSGSIGISAVYLTTGKIEGRDESGNKSNDFYSSDLAIMLSHARQINTNMQLGGSIKLIRQSIADENADGFAIDAGVMRKISGRVNLGLTIRNLGPKMEFIDEKYSLPLSVIAGTSYNLVGIFNLAMDIAYEPVDKKRTICLGTEFFPMQFFALRAGYLFQAVGALYNSGNNISNSKVTEQNGLGGGIGIKVLGYNLDYAIVPYSNLGTTQRISFTAKF
ncbi:MAG: PorV/PorQ family protein [bacterium]